MATSAAISYATCFRRKVSYREWRVARLQERNIVAKRSQTLPNPQLFVVVSTGQNVANLPPILEHAQPGDWIVWIESEAARREKWATGARKVLGQPERELHTLERPIFVPQVNDPVQLARECRRFLEEVERDEYRGWSGEEEKSAFRQLIASLNHGSGRTFLVCNGGNKLTPIGLLHGWANVRPIVLYGDDSPAQCWTFSRGLDQSPDICRYQRHTLDLPDILTTTGHVLQNPGAAERFWPGSLPSDLAREPYGNDTGYTGHLHEQHARWATIEAGKDLPTYEALPLLLPPERIDQWKRSLEPLSRAGKRFFVNDEMLRAAYGATTGLAQDGALAKARSGQSPPQVRIGNAFERAVAARVHAWLEHTKHPAVQSAWRNVEVSRLEKKRKDDLKAQFDVVLVLKNGIIWYLECKSATIELKDLSARILNLQQACSQLARMVVCVPIPTQHAREPWFEQLHLIRTRLDESNIPFVPFTLPQQPATYLRPEKDSDPVVWQCPIFESELERYLKRFEPRL